MAKTKEFGQLIPQDDGEDTICYQITIPNTSEWRVLLHSLFFHWTAGRYWKRTLSGRTIKSVQSKAWEIYKTLGLCEDNSTEVEIETEVIRIVRQTEVICMNCCCQNGDTQILDGIEDEQAMIPASVENGLLPEDLPTPVDPDFLEWKCKCSKQIVDLLIQAIGESRDFIDIGRTTTAEMQELIEGVFDQVDGGEYYSYLWEVWQYVVYTILHLMTVAITTSLINFLTVNRNQIVEIMYCQESTIDTKNACQELSRGSSSLSLISKVVMDVWWNMTPWEALYQTATQRMNAPLYSVVIATYVDDCVCMTPTSGGLPPVPDAKYEYVEMLVDIDTPVNGGVFDHTNNIYEFTGGGNSGTDLTMFEPQFNSSPVPNANRAGFAIQLLGKSIAQGDDFGHNLINASTQVSEISFGGGVSFWSENLWFGGTSPAFADLVTSMGGDADFEHTDLDSDSDEGKLVFRFLFYNGNTGNPPNSNATMRAFWIVDTTGL